MLKRLIVGIMLLAMVLLSGCSMAAVGTTTYKQVDVGASRVGEQKKEADHSRTRTLYVTRTPATSPATTPTGRQYRVSRVDGQIVIQVVGE